MGDSARLAVGGMAQSPDVGNCGKEGRQSRASFPLILNQWASPFRRERSEATGPPPIPPKNPFPLP